MQHMHRPEFEKLLTATVPSLLMLCEDYVCFVLSLQDLDRQNTHEVASLLEESVLFQLRIYRRNRPES